MATRATKARAMKRKPLEVARSGWERDYTGDDLALRLQQAGARAAAVWVRRVGDGTLRAITALEPAGYHLSISFADHRGRPVRYPRWDEIAEARYSLLPADITLAMILPPLEEYVSLHDTTFHLHQIDPDTAG
jgi:hypothetical protein